MSRQRKSKQTKQQKRPKAKRTRRPVGEVRAEQARRVKTKKLDDLLSIAERAKKALPSDDYETLVALINTFAFTTSELSKKRVSLKRLQKILFGETSEKTAAVLAGLLKDDEAAEQDDTDEANSGTDGEANACESGDAEAPKVKRKGHGRRSAAEYTGADKTAVPHEALTHKDACPECDAGIVYTMKEPAVVVRVTGVGPLAATVHEMERLRCNLCGKVFQAAAPEGVGTKKYDVSVIVMIALLKYGYGMPFKRLEALSGNMGIPLPASTQWELVETALEPFEAVANELACTAAQGDVLYIDDTKMKVLDLHAALAKRLKEDKSARTGVRTSGIVSTVGDHKIALFYTGEKHAGENLADVLAFRDAKLAAPIQMADALACNTAHDLEVIIAKCLVHGRRKFVDIVHNFPVEVVHIVQALRTVFFNEATTKREHLNPDERLAYHQRHSKPVMDELKNWMLQKIEDRDVEPNSALGKAINYMDAHWEGLTRFLTVAGAPMENNTVERALKWAIRHRRNSLFYKTVRGAKVGDTYMTLLYTCDLNGHNGWDYLLALAKHPELATGQPQKWLPWTYEATLKSLAGEK